MEMPNQQRSFHTNMVRAREVWAAAFPKKPGLDLLNAKKLGRDLDWASTWMRVDTTHTKESDANALREHLENIERAARNLWKLIGSAKLVDQVAELLSYNYPTRAVPNFADLEVHLKDLEKAAHKAKECQRRTMPSKGFSALDRFIFRLAKVFRETGEKPGVSTTNGQKGGPFVRFVQETSRQFDLRLPSGEAIATALRKEKRADLARRHVIGLLKNRHE